MTADLPSLEQHQVNTDEDLVLGITIDQMKLDPSLKWRDLDNYSTSQTSNNYTKGNQTEDTIAPSNYITSHSKY